MSGLSRALYRALCVLVSCLTFFAQAVPWIRRESAQDASDGSRLTVHGGSLLEAALAPGAASLTADEEASRTSEADRLWFQFRALDSRFDEAAEKYMRSVQQSLVEDPYLQLRALNGDSRFNEAVAKYMRSVQNGRVEDTQLSKQPAKPQVKDAQLGKDMLIREDQERANAMPHSHDQRKQHATNSKAANHSNRDTIREGARSAAIASDRLRDHDWQRSSSTHAKRDSNMLPYGFYVHAFYEAAAVVNQLRSIRIFYPEAPVYVMSDGGANYSGICKSIANCKFAWKAPAHDCWNPKPFLDRFREGALWLKSKKAEYTIFLEPDVTLHKRASLPLRDGAAAGGLRDEWNPTIPIKLRELAQDLGRKFSGNDNFTISWERFGFAGGSIIRTEAAIIAFRPDYINWIEFERLWNKEVYSSDIAMLIALATHGFDYYPWQEVSQPENAAQYDHDTAFHHHKSISGYPGGKPFYGVSLADEDEHLVTPPPKSMQPLGHRRSHYQCQHCVWVDEAECWPKKLDGKSELKYIECPAVDEESFRQQTWNFKTESPRPDLFRNV